MLKKLVSVLTNRWFLLGTGLVVGAAAILGIRFFTYEPEITHYHANFAVYVNGQQEQFKGTQYYEETAGQVCTLEKVDNPVERAHMHDNVNSVVHAKDRLATWGNFFQNLGFGLGDDYLRTDDKIYNPNEQSKLTFILNGDKVESVANKIIGDQDKLLVSFGDASSDQLNEQYNSIKNEAKKYDIEQDPATCSGNQLKVDTAERLKHLF